MIAFLRGYVAALYEGSAVIDVGGVGYEVRVAGETVQRLAAAGRDEEVLVYTYTYLREDQIALYGFGSREDLELFKLLITVSGIGPKGGLALLSVGTADDLRFAIMTGDSKMISRAPGIGKKTAERVIRYPVCATRKCLPLPQETRELREQAHLTPEEPVWPVDRTAPLRKP